MWERETKHLSPLLVCEGRYVELLQKPAFSLGPRPSAVLLSMITYLSVGIVELDSRSCLVNTRLWWMKHTRKPCFFTSTIVCLLVIIVTEKMNFWFLVIYLPSGHNSVVSNICLPSAPLYVILNVHNISNAFYFLFSYISYAAASVRK